MPTPMIADAPAVVTTRTVVPLSPLQRQLMAAGWRPMPIAPVRLLKAAASLVCESCFSDEAMLAAAYWHRGKCLLVCRCQSCKTETTVESVEGE